MSINIENLNYNDFKNICRTCLFNYDLKSIQQDTIIIEVLYILTGVRFEINDELPQQICRNCLEKINEIHEFAVQCKQTYSRLRNSLNLQLNQEASTITVEVKQETKALIKVKEEITIDDHKFEFAEVQELQLLNEPVFDEVNIKQEISEDMILETSEFNNDLNIHCSENELVTPATSKIKIGNDVSTNSSNSSQSFDIQSAKIDKEIYNKNKDKQYTCDACNKSFIYLASFKRHKSYLNCEIRNKCKQCEKSFSKTNDLKRHMRVHSGERPFKCKQCSKAFSQSIHLKEHMRTHNGERPYMCKQCPNAYTLSKHLKQHMISSHSNERPYKCKQCSKTFTRSSDLKRHMLTHSGQYPYKCEQCTKSFNQLGYLKKHMRTHSSESSYK